MWPGWASFLPTVQSGSIVKRYGTQLLLAEAGVLLKFGDASRIVLLMISTEFLHAGFDGR
jgi:hypothetical protein